MRSLLIDTDTASDDAVALLLAVKEPDVALREKVEEAVRFCPNRALKVER